MKNERKIQVLAEADGWKPHNEISFDGENFNEEIRIKGFKRGHEFEIYMPDYLTSRDAIVPAIVKWCGDDHSRWVKFMLVLGKVTGSSISSNPAVEFRITFSACAKQLSDAHIKAMGKWEEV